MSEQQSISSSPGSKRHRFFFYALLAIPACFGPLSIDLLVPSLPSLAEDLGARSSDTQLSIYAFVLAYGLAPFFWGSLSDRYGRKPLLLLGISLYALTSLACTLAPSITVLVVLRFFQGFAASAGIVIARAMLRDRYGAAGTTQAISTLYMFLAVIPIVLPIIGGYLSLILSWADLFLAMCLVAAACLLGVALSIPETLRKSAEASESSEQAAVVVPARVILANRQFLRSSLTNMFAMTGTVLFVGNYSFLSSSTYLTSAEQHGYTLALYNLSLAVGIYIVRGLVPWLGVGRSIRFGVGVLTGAWCVIALVCLNTIPSMLLLMALLMLASFGHGIIMALSPGEALVPFSLGAGKASAFYGCIQSVGASLISYAVALLAQKNLAEISVAVAVCALCSALCFALIKNPLESASSRD